MNPSQRLRAAEKAAKRVFGKRCPDCGGPYPCYRVFVRMAGRCDLDTACKRCLPRCVHMLDLGDEDIPLPL